MTLPRILILATLGIMIALAEPLQNGSTNINISGHSGLNLGGRIRRNPGENPGEKRDTFIYLRLPYLMDKDDLMRLMCRSSKELNNEFLRDLGFSTIEHIKAGYVSVKLFPFLIHLVKQRISPILLFFGTKLRRERNRDNQRILLELEFLYDMETLDNICLVTGKNCSSSLKNKFRYNFPDKLETAFHIACENVDRGLLEEHHISCHPPERDSWV